MEQPKEARRRRMLCLMPKSYATTCGSSSRGRQGMRHVSAQGKGCSTSKQTRQPQPVTLQSQGQEGCSALGELVPVLFVAASQASQHGLSLHKVLSGQGHQATWAR